MASALQSTGHKPRLLLEDANEVTAGLTVAAVYLTGGLEFDAVALVGASHDAFGGVPLLGRLLYIGITRAAHSLHVHCVGLPAPQLGLTAQRP